MREIILPETKPAFEWINGRAVQKVSPRRKHALAQTTFAAALNAWARLSGAGMVGTEWRFQIEPPGEERRPLVPDVAFLSYERLPYDVQLETDVPRIAPDVAVEILSPGDRQLDIEEKVRVYLAAGTRAVVLVDTAEQIVTIRETAGSRRLACSEEFQHESLPGFSMPVIELFTPPQPKQPSR
jgi:Uma2 family endonuclease